ncbi:hypothetical protein, conserved [Plasmodium gonderi]|uniref:Uncharacterized protein n=1 Tax=Plasmodium gonderi TaxID=77519 RepID=A0A1Y1JLD5_PLAGO|nr:hypothetical protein, conserved [Plasmodium gonderi]GAW80854.1 hypothetical protein, conserved [Plasmodium gonderi]
MKKTQRKKKNYKNDENNIVGENKSIRNENNKCSLDTSFESNTVGIYSSTHSTLDKCVNRLSDDKEVATAEVATEEVATKKVGDISKTISDTCVEEASSNFGSFGINETVISSGENKEDESIIGSAHVNMCSRRGKKEDSGVEEMAGGCRTHVDHSTDEGRDENDYERTDYMTVNTSIDVIKCETEREHTDEESVMGKNTLEKHENESGGRSSHMESSICAETKYKEKKVPIRKNTGRGITADIIANNNKRDEKMDNLKGILHDQLKKKKKILEEKLRVRQYEKSKLEEDVKNAGVELFRINKENEFLNKKKHELSMSIKNIKCRKDKQLCENVELKKNYKNQMMSLKKELNYQTEIFNKFNNSLLEFNNLKKYFDLVNANSKISENMFSSGLGKLGGKEFTQEESETGSPIVPDTNVRSNANWRNRDDIHSKVDSLNDSSSSFLVGSEINKKQSIISKMNHEINKIQNDINTKKEIEENEKMESSNLERLIRDEKDEYGNLKNGKNNLMKELNESINKMKQRDEAIDLMNIKLNELKSIIHDLEIEKDVLTKEHMAEKDKKEKLQIELDALEKESKRVQKGKENLEKKIDKIIEENAKAKVEIQNEREKCAEMKEEIAKLNKDMQNRGNKIKIVKNDINKNIEKIINLYTEEIKVSHFSSKLKNDLGIVKENITKKENEIENYKNGIVRIKIQQILESTKIENIQKKVKKLNEEFNEKNEKFSNYGNIIKKNHYLIENKQLEVDRLNEEFDKKKRKNCDDHGMPVTLNMKIQKLNKQIIDVLKQSRELEKDWFMKQSEMIKIQNENQKISEEMLRGKDLRLILSQKKCELQENFKTIENVLKKINKNIMYIRLQLEKFSSKNTDTLAEINKIEDAILRRNEKKNIKCEEYKHKKENLKNDITNLKNEKEKYQQDLVNYENKILLLENQFSEQKKLQGVIKQYTDNKDILFLKKQIQTKNTLIENVKKQQNVLLANIKLALNKRNELDNKKEVFQKHYDNGVNVSFKIQHEISFIKKNVKDIKNKKLSLANYLNELTNTYDNLTSQAEHEQTKLINVNRECNIFEGMLKVHSFEKKHRFQELLKFQNAVKNITTLANSKKPYDHVRKTCFSYKKRLLAIEKKIRTVNTADENLAKFISVILEWVVN